MRKFITSSFFLLLAIIVFYAVTITNGWAGQAALMVQTKLQVQQRGYLKCGVNSSLPGFSFVDEKGNWSGLDVDFCRGLAAVILEDITKVKFVPLSDKERLVALQSGKVDLLARNQTWTRSRDTTMGLSFVGPLYFDELAILIRKGALTLDTVEKEAVQPETAAATQGKQIAKKTKVVAGNKQASGPKSKEEAAGLKAKETKDKTTVVSKEVEEKSYEESNKSLVEIRDENITSYFASLKDVNFCLSKNSRARSILTEMFRKEEIGLTQTVYNENAEKLSGLISGECDAIVADKFDLYRLLKQLPEPEQWQFFEKSLTLEPIGPMVRESDSRWFKIVRWTLLALLQAESIGLSQGNIEARLKKPKYTVKQFVRQNAFFQSRPLLPSGWSKRLIFAVGNYGELFERNVGMGSILKVDRGLNNLWQNDGLMYSPSFR